MIRFTVAWHQLAEDRLTELWMQSADRAAITRAAYLIDRELAVDVEQKGTPVVQDIHEFTIDPLRVYYRYSLPDRLVTVLYLTLTT